MKEVMKIASGMGLLIGIYLVLRDASSSASIINSLSSATTSTIKTLQAR